MTQSILSVTLTKEESLHARKSVRGASGKANPSMVADSRAVTMKSQNIKVDRNGGGRLNEREWNDRRRGREVVAKFPLRNE